MKIFPVQLDSPAQLRTHRDCAFLEIVCLTQVKQVDILVFERQYPVGPPQPRLHVLDNSLTVTLAVQPTCEPA